MAYSDERVTQPLRRKDDGTFEPIDWDTAFKEIGAKVQDIIAKNGPESLAIIQDPRPSGKQYSARFMNALGSANVYAHSSSCNLSKESAYQLTIGATGYSNDFANAKMVMFIGRSYGDGIRPSSVQSLADAAEHGTRVVIVDPRLNNSGIFASDWVPINPGTDAALLMAWTKWIIDNEKYDEDFCTNWTNMPYLVNPETRLTLKPTECGLEGTDADYVIWDPAQGKPVVLEYPMNEGVTPPLFGTYEIDGKQYPTGGQLLKESVEEFTLAKAAEICWLDEGQIEKALEIYTTGQSGIMQGVPIDQYEQSQQCALGALNLEYLMGNVQKPGAMLQSFKACPARDQIPNTPRFLKKEKMLKRLGVQEHKGLLDWDMAFIPAVFKAMKDGDPYQIHAWFERSGNKHVVLGNATCLDEIVPNLDFVCHIFMYPTAFSVLCADMLLPSAEWLETNLVIPQLNAIVIRQAVTHLFETVEEGLIWTQIVQKMAEMGNVHAQEPSRPRARTASRCTRTSTRSRSCTSTT